jgi:voltage-gated potassium channel
MAEPGRGTARLRQLGGTPLGPGELRFFARRLAFLGAAILALLAIGTIGFAAIEGVSIGFAFEWTLDTIATVGSIPNPSEPGARVLKVVLEVLGVGTLFYALVTVTEFFVAGHLGELLRDRRTQRMIESLSEHHLICGFGRVGRQVARDLAHARQTFVVIDDNPANRTLAEERGAPFVEGSPSDDEILTAAGIDLARALIACMDSDAENIFTTLTARELRDDLLIIARASVEDTEKKLRRAGADRVISPYKTSGSEMARLALTPQVVDVVDVAPAYRMEEIEVSPGCRGDGHSIDEVRGAALVVALRRAGGALQPMPPGATALAGRDIVVAMGPDAEMDRLEAEFEAPAGAEQPARG